jgi:aminoglycoside phosphotransferase
MTKLAETVTTLEPPADVPEMQRGDWFRLATPDPVAQYLGGQLWYGPVAPLAWEVARLSHAAYIYRETETHWATVAKFYTIKTKDRAERYADRELESTRRATAAGLVSGTVRAVQPLATWRGVLFLEYVDGLTLEDVIAVRRSRPGTLAESLDGVARLLATLHTHSPQAGATPEFEGALEEAHRYIRDLVRWGVLESDPVVQNGLTRQIERWASRAAMTDFAPVLTHGDATTTNFIFPWQGGVVGVDWERLYEGDPAADLGRLMAEVAHSVNQHGGSVAEASPFVARLADAYARALPPSQDARRALERARFYQASSTLRIARNGWVSQVDRMGLVAQALALLSA